MVKIAIIYHSGFGHTQVQAEAVAQGVNAVEGAQAQLVKADEIIDHLESLSSLDGMIFGSPTYMGSVSAPFKAFMDASSKIWFQQGWKDKVAAGFTNSHSLSGDKLNSLIQMTIFAMQHGMIWVGQAEPNQSPDGQPGKPDAINRMGSTLGAMAQSENQDPAITPPAGDLKTAELLGTRVAQITLQLRSNQSH